MWLCWQITLHNILFRGSHFGNVSSSLSTIDVSKSIIVYFRRIVIILNRFFILCEWWTKKNVICQHMWLCWQITFFCVSRFQAVWCFPRKICVSRCMLLYFLQIIISLNCCVLYCGGNKIITASTCGCAARFSLLLPHSISSAGNVPRPFKDSPRFSKSSILLTAFKQNDDPHSLLLQNTPSTILLHLKHGHYGSGHYMQSSKVL